MTPSPFRRLRDALVAYRATLTGDGDGDRAATNAAWAEYEAAEVAARGYVRTPREDVEAWVESVAFNYAELVRAEAAGEDTGRHLQMLEVVAEALADGARKLHAAEMARAEQ